MKVLQVTNLYPFEGAPTYGIFVKEQIDSLKNKDFQDVFFINARVHGFRAYFSSVPRLKAIIDNYDVIHCHHQFSAVTVFMANPRKKIIISILGDIKKRSVLNKLVYYFVKRVSKRIIFKNQLPDNSKKNILLPNGVNLDFFKPITKEISRNHLKLENENKYILFVSNGSLDNPIKRHDKFLNIIKKLNSNTQETRMIIPLYLSNVSREQVPYYFNAADLMILTSDHEGSPNAVKEAMACNLPIVSTFVGDVPVLLKGVDNSYVSTSGTVNNLTQLAQKIDYNRRSNGRAKLIELGIESDSTAQKLIKIYKDLF